MAHYLVVDLEATCWPGRQQPNTETIEIGAVIIDENFQISSEFSSVIRPVRYPILTTFCTKLTGISQKEVDNAHGFVYVFRNFVEWYSDFTQFYSWGTFDLIQFRKDCKYHKIPYLFEHHIDLSMIFTKKIGRRKGHRGAMKILGIPSTGKHHRGIDDARNIAKMLPILMEARQWPDT